MNNSINQILHKFERNYKKIELTLDRLAAFMVTLGNPQNHLPPTIHIAGTNGKGSSFAFLRAMIEAEGKTCHVYTSPHLISFNERIVLNGKNIADDELLSILQEMDTKASGHNLTFFEITTAAAFVAFSRHKADFLLLETGLGGRFDATNLVPNPVMCLFTPISYDHMEFLGNTLPLIAAEKYAIKKPGAILLSAPQEPEVAEVLQNVEFAPTGFALPELALKGKYQQTNAYLAIAAARKLGISEKAIAAGLQNAKWPARMQRLAENLWLDGAHNDAGAKALAENLEGNWVMLTGMLKTKDSAAYFSHFKGKVKAIYTIPIENDPQARTPEELADIASQLEFAAHSCKSFEEALARAQKEHADCNIIIAGSLYLAGQILEKLNAPA